MIEKIIKYHSITNGNASETSRRLKEEGYTHDRHTIIKYWNKYNLFIRGRGGANHTQRGRKYLKHNPMEFCKLVGIDLSDYV